MAGYTVRTMDTVVFLSGVFALSVRYGAADDLLRAVERDLDEQVEDLGLPPTLGRAAQRRQDAMLNRYRVEPAT